MTKTKKYDLESLKEIGQTYLVDKSPISMPENLKEFLVKAAPILVIIGIVFLSMALIATLGIGPFALSIAALGGHRFGWMTIVSLISIIASIAVSVIILPGLKNRTQKVWNLMYYFGWFSLLINILSGAIISALISALISFWVLFQLRDKYTK